ncbi:hypothetical protein M404DRAFT_34663 [Pisolithus tinctorius Marx 270]|uniref:Uncharacterized protein n=1 Tax=Pisolithus tinctorius Marx 270 TaxID=870435 RepID=A0A0C3ICQ5_PISTI|nr:hypothetical protein M404DRAFT_34663 [Pisolithus tinctorius Marx 270]
MDTQYDAEHGYDDWVPTDVEDASSIVAQGIEQSVTGDEDCVNFDIDELEVLVRRWSDWKESGKTKKPMILQSILAELHELDKNTELSHAEMQLKAGLVTAWLKIPLLVRELYHDHVQKKLATMREDTGDEEGPKPIGFYQQVLTAFIQDDLSDEQLAATQDIAAKWNGMEGPAPNIKAKNAAKYGYKYFCNFAEEMWRYCGMWVICFAGWKNAEGTMEACTMDFNRDIVDGTSFNEVWNLEGSWRDYLGEAFEEDEISNDDDDGQNEGSTRKKAGTIVKVDPVTLVTKEDGTVSIGEIAVSVRFLNVSFSNDRPQGQTCRKATAAVPFKQLGAHQWEMIATEHLPANFSFTVDLSHMLVSAATKLLSFWRQRQAVDMGNVFAFQMWLDRSGTLQPPVEDGRIPLQIARDRRSRSRMPATARARSKAPARTIPTSDRQGEGQGRANTFLRNVQSSDVDAFPQASPAIFAAVDMPGPSHDHRRWVNSRAKSSHPKRLHCRSIVPETDTDHDDDPLEDRQPQEKQVHDATPIPRKTMAQIRPDDEHPKDTRRVRNKTPFPGRAMKAPTISYADEDAFDSDEVDGSEALGAADGLPTLSKATAVHIRQIEARGEDPPQSTGPSRRGQKAGTIQRSMSHGGHSQMPEHFPPQPRLSEVSASMVDLIPPPPPPCEDTAPIEDEIPPPPPPPDDLEDRGETPPPPPSDEDETENALIPPPPPPSDDVAMINDPIPPPPPSSQESDSHHSVTSPDGDDTPMDTDASSKQPPAPSSDDTRFLAEDIRIAHPPLLEDRPDVFSCAERCRLHQRFMHLYSTWMGHSLSDGEKHEMEVHGFVHPGADHAVYWAIHQLRLTCHPIQYHFPFHPNERFDAPVTDAMARMATDFAYVVL